MSSRTRTSLVGLMALASLAACTGATAPPPALGRASTGAAATVATFEGRFDPATGALTIQTTPSAEASSRLGRSAFEPFVDGAPGTGPANTFELRNGTVVGAGTACPGSAASWEADVVLTSFFATQAFSNVAIEFTNLVPAGREACNSVAAYEGMSAAFGLWDYGAIAANGTATRTWRFAQPTSGAFSFKGRIMAQAAPLTAPANGATAFDWSPSMFMDPPHSFQDVATTTAHVVWNGSAFVDTKALITFVPVGTPLSTSVGLTYPPKAYARAFSGSSYFVADAANGGNTVDTTGNFTVCAKFKPGANPALDVFRIIVAKGDPVDNATGTGWALAHFGPLAGGPEPEYSFMYRAAAGGEFVRSIYGPQDLPADPNDRAYEYVCGGRNVNSVQVGAFGQLTGTSFAVSGTFPTPANLPLVIGAAAGGTNPYVDGGVYEVIFDSRAATPAVMNELVAAAEGRRTYNGGAFVGSATRVPGVVGANGATFVLPQGSSYPISTDASGLLDAGKVLAFGGTTAGFGPVLPVGTTEYCIGAEVTSADWAAASGCVLGVADSGDMRIFFEGGTVAGTNGSAFRALAAPTPSPGRHKVMVCYPTAVPQVAALYVDGVQRGLTSNDGGAPFDIVAGQVQVGTCLTPGPLVGARVGRVFACPSANPALCN